MKEEIKEITKRRKKPAKNKLSVLEFDLLEFKRVLNQSPPDVLIRKNKDYNSRSLSIQVVEQMLNALYISYQIEMPHPPVLMEGQVLFTVNVKVLHPVLKEWLTYSGTSCIPLIAADQEKHKYNHANLGAGKSFAIVNAVKNIGQIFRAEKDSYAEVMKDYFTKKQNNDSDNARSEEISRMVKLIEQCKMPAQLKTFFPKIQSMDNQGILDLYKAKLKSFKTK